MARTSARSRLAIKQARLRLLGPAPEAGRTEPVEKARRRTELELQIQELQIQVGEFRLPYREDVD